LYLKDHYHVKNIDIKLLMEVSKIIEGKHNFLSFSKFSNKQNNDCEIFASKWVFDDKNHEKLLYIIHGNRFLHHMVRYLVGSMIAVSQNKISIDDFRTLLNKPIKDAKIFKAPSNGLVLKEIFYEN
ncbi:MAG: tRNA pseudouridine(38-40) synthase TruA, partial [Candidatus Neomarinimicrobiota bacterium]